jgi:predicted RNase H-like HicB family nuclease
LLSPKFAEVNEMAVAEATAITVKQVIIRQVQSVQPPLTFTVEVEWLPEEGIYLARCPEMKAIGWGETLKEAVDELADEIWDFADVLVEDHAKDPNLHDPRLPYARFFFSLGSPERVRAILV